MIRSILCVAIGLAASITFADTPATQPATRPARGDTLTVSAVVDAPAQEIFDCFKTGSGFAKAMGVAKAKVDFRIGGAIRSAYKPETDLDSEQAIVNTILSYEPNRMISIKPTPPAGSPDWLAAICRTGWNVITLDPLGVAQTRVTIVGMGFEQGELFDAAYEFFEQGNTATLQVMQKNLGRPELAAADARAFELVKAAVGEWTARETKPDGKVLRGRTVWKSSLDGKFIEVHGELGDDQAIHPHAIFLCGIDPETKTPMFLQVMETGAIAHGHLSLIDDKTVGSNWHFVTPDGVAEWFITMEFSAAQYTQRMWRGKQRDGEPAITVHYHRVATPSSTDAR